MAAVGAHSGGANSTDSKGVDTASVATFSYAKEEGGEKKGKEEKEGEAEGRWRALTVPTKVDPVTEKGGDWARPKWWKGGVGVRRRAVITAGKGRWSEVVGSGREPCVVLAQL